MSFVHKRTENNWLQLKRMVLLKEDMNIIYAIKFSRMWGSTKLIFCQFLLEELMIGQ